ncbi:hypothetical protein N9L68_07280 [bacterium]|nr:hypothetical protein [bacterium]
MVDSGAGTTVVGTEDAKAVKATDPDPNRTYRLADGSLIQSKGQHMSFKAPTADVQVRSVNAGAAEVDTPFLSVSQVGAGCPTVVFSPKSYRGTYTHSICGFPKTRRRLFAGRLRNGRKTPPRRTRAQQEGTGCSAGEAGSDSNTLAMNDHPGQAVKLFRTDNGLSHHGQPKKEEEEEEEVIVIEEPERQGGDETRVVRMPRVPTQKDIEAHSATHILHEEWCEFCVAGRGRNKPHNTRPPRGEEDTSEAVDASNGSLVEDVPPSGPVPRTCMDYFYVSSRREGRREGAGVCPPGSCRTTGRYG